MATVNMLDAKTNLSRLVAAVESGAEEEIIIARNGRPAVRIVPLMKSGGVRLGLAKGKYAPFVIDEALDREIADLFYQGSIFPPEEEEIVEPRDAA